MLEEETVQASRFLQRSFPRPCAKMKTGAEVRLSPSSKQVATFFDEITVDNMNNPE